jgi:hypothetical protein
MSKSEGGESLTVTIVPDDGGKVDVAMVDAVALLKKGYSLSTINLKLRRLRRPATAFYGEPAVS